MKQQGAPAQTFKRHAKAFGKEKRREKSRLSMLGSLIGSLLAGPAAICCIGVSGLLCSGALFAQPPVHP
jgi:hypothetical protein